MLGTRFRKSIRVAVLLVVATGLSACLDARGGSIPYDRPLAMPDEPKLETLDSGYKIAPMDTLSVKVFRSEDLTGEYEVDLVGNISLPLVGEVKAASLTTSQLDDELSRKLGEKYLQDPDVSVSLKRSAGRVVTVDGAVYEPGAFPFVRPITLIQAIAAAKGTREEANPRRVAVFRMVGGQRQAAAFDLTSIRRGEAEDPMIYPGDIVVVDGSRIKEIQKQILNSLPVLSVFRPF